MTISISKPHTSNTGVRPINLRYDARQILRLLDVAFGSDLDPKNRRSLQRSLSLMNQGWYPSIATFPRSLTPGFVWEDEKKIVGNASLMPSKTPQRFLVANVAVHPSWRRQGIARQIMTELITYVRWGGGRTIMLQVKESNESARRLYRTLGFKKVGTMTHWYAKPMKVKQMPASSTATIRSLQRHEWKDAYELDLSSLHSDLNWPDPIPTNIYKTGLWQWIDNILNNRQVEHWATSDNNNQLTGIASIYSQWNRTHVLTIRVAPAYRGQLEQQLLAKLTRRLPHLSHHQLRLDHPSNDAVMNQLLQEANFQSKRTLAIMRLDLV